MDRLSQLRGEAGGSGDSTLDTTSPPSEAFMSADENSSKYFSINDSTFDISPIKDVSLASTSADAEPSATIDSNPIKDVSLPSTSADGDRSDTFDINPIKDVSLPSASADADRSATFDINPIKDVSLPSTSSEADRSATFNINPIKDVSLPSTSAGAERSATFNIDPIKDVSLPSTSADANHSDGDKLISNISPIGKKELNSYKIGKQIEAANILSGGVDIFDGDDNSFDGDELVIDDNMEEEDKANEVVEEAMVDNIPEAEPDLVEPEVNVAIASREMEVVLQIDGNNLNAIDIGNGLYLYRRDGQDELAAVQVVRGDPHSFKFLKVRDNAEGNLEVYEEIEIEVPTKGGKRLAKNTPHVPTVDIIKSTSDSSSNRSKIDSKNKLSEIEPIASTSTGAKNTDQKRKPSESQREVNFNGKMVKFNEPRKSPVVGSFTPMTFHSTPNKEGKPLTKTMVDLQLDPNRHSDNVKKTIEVHTENVKLKAIELPAKEKDSVETVKSNNPTPKEEMVSTEKLKEVTSKQEDKKDGLKKKDEQHQTGAAKFENTIEICKSEVKMNKEKDTIDQRYHVTEDQNRKITENDSSTESIQRETKEDNTDAAISQKEIALCNEKTDNIILSKSDKPVIPSASVSNEQNKSVASTSVLNKKHETISNVVEEQLKPSNTDKGVELVPNISKVIEKLTDKVMEFPEKTSKESLLVVEEKVRNITSEGKENETEKVIKSPGSMVKETELKVAEKNTNSELKKDGNKESAEVKIDLSKRTIPAIQEKFQNITSETKEVEKDRHAENKSNLLGSTAEATIKVDEEKLQNITNELKEVGNVNPVENKNDLDVIKAQDAVPVVVEKLQNMTPKIYTDNVPSAENKNNLVGSKVQAAVPVVIEKLQNITPEIKDMVKLPPTENKNNLFASKLNTAVPAVVNKNQNINSEIKYVGNVSPAENKSNLVGSKGHVAVPAAVKKLQNITPETKDRGKVPPAENKSNLVGSEVQAGEPAVVEKLQMITSEINTDKARPAENKDNKMGCTVKAGIPVTVGMVQNITFETSEVDKATSAENNYNLVESTKKTFTPTIAEKVVIPTTVEKVQNISSERKEFVQDKPSKIKILENITLKFPMTSNSDNNNPPTQSVKNVKSDDDNLIKIPLESFSEVSSTCTNLGNEESKEERITLYSIDTDESVSLISPSSTTKIDDKGVLNDVLTTISSMSNIQSENTSIKNVPLSMMKEPVAKANAKNEADSTSKLSEQVNCSKSEKDKIGETSNRQKSAQEIKDNITVMETKLQEKQTSSSPLPKGKDTDKLASCSSVLREKTTTVENSALIRVPLLIKPHLTTFAPVIKSSDKVVKPETKPLAKIPQHIHALQSKSVEMPVKSTLTQNVKSALKPETRSQEKAPSLMNLEKKYPPAVGRPLSKTINIASYPIEVKQSNNYSTAGNKPVKPDSHIPVVSVANKPTSKLIPVIAPKAVTMTKPADNAATKKETLIKLLDKTSTVTKIERREVKEQITKFTVESKPVNNNHAAAVPFGKWTDANRQEFLNKFKEVKAPINSNSKQIKNSNDLNRRDVLQKIDSQRAQTIINATAKAHEKTCAKTETVFSSKVVSPTVETKALPCDDISDNKIKQGPSKVITMKQEKSLKSSASSSSIATDVNPKTVAKLEHVSTDQSNISKIEPDFREQSIVGKTVLDRNDQITIAKTEPALKDQATSTKTECSSRDQNTASCYMASLIDRTIEDMINRVAPAKNGEESKQAVLINPTEQDSESQKPVSTFETKPTAGDSDSLDDIEMKMNELHGIPFVERPPHELPKVLKPEIKTYGKTDKPKSLCIVSKPTNPKFTNEPKLKDVDSDEELIDHEPVTGDMGLKKKTEQIKIIPKDKSKEVVTDKQVSNKNAHIITETQFDKFARRNSVTYENCLTVNFDHIEPENSVQLIKGKDLALNANPKLSVQSIRPHIQSEKIKDVTKHGSAVKDSSNKKYQSKIHSAYQSVLTAKHQVSPPISIIEDKPVKVVFVESNTCFVPSQLNVQGQELSPSKKPVFEVDTPITANNDAVDSGISEITDENKQYERVKTKHQRKQVLTPVEEPDLELIQPSDIGIETISRKKKKVEEFKSKSLVPKKSYLLGRNTTTEDEITSDEISVKDNTKQRSEDVPERKDTASAIDNLVKAAELLDNQAENANKNVTSSPDSQTNTPVKRGRGRPRKYPLPDGTVDEKSPSPQKKPRLIDAKPIKQDSVSDELDYDSSEEAIVRENWTMGKINENIVCPICNKLFRSENVVFKHVKHCTGVSPNRSDSDKRSPRRSRLSQESDDMDYETSSDENKKETPEKRKSKDTVKSEAKPNTKSDKSDVIVIEDTPIKQKSEKPRKEKEEEDPVKESNAKVSHRNKSLICEFCGKTFRQQSYLASHKLLHNKEKIKKTDRDTQDSNKSQVFSCEVCKKEFRKLHHLVQHRINHNPEPLPKRALRKSLTEQNDAKIGKGDAVVKQVEDASAGFRCEPCDKSFRKLHHLVEHRGTHDGINRQKPSTPIQPTVEKPPLPPQCDICKKTFRKLHHLIEHKEQHNDTNSDKSDDKSNKSALSTKDIIHECSLCYMVFPNEHSLNKHSANCSKKKRQSKQLKDSVENESSKNDENLENKNDDVEITDTPKTVVTEIIDDDDDGKQDEASQDNAEVKTLPDVVQVVEIKHPAVVEVKKVEDAKESTNEVTDKPLSKEEIRCIEPIVTPAKRGKSDSIKEKEKPAVPAKIKKVDLKEVKNQDIQKNKTVVKVKSTTNVTKRDKSIDAPAPPADTIKPSVESSDDDEIRYMFNPNFKVDETSEGKSFMKVRAKKRNSLQIERPSSNDVAKRRISLQLPPKVSRSKPKSAETRSKAADPKPKAHETNTKPGESKSKLADNNISLATPLKAKQTPKLPDSEAVSTDSDDSDVKYSFPKTAPEPSKPVSERKSKGTEPVPEKKPKIKEPVAEKKPKVKAQVADKKTKATEQIAEKKPKVTEKKAPRKSLVEKRKSLGGIAKRKSLGKAISVKHKANLPPPIKKRSLGVEHRCDCGELFSSAALLARHTSLAHTPPRIRRERAPPAPPPAPAHAAKPPGKQTRKPAATKPDASASERSRKPAADAARTTRRSAAHSGVPVPEKMRKMMQKNAK